MAFTPYPEFSDQVAVITGGSRGIGFATARRFLERGARVGICALDPERLAEAARVLGALGEVESVVIDVRSMEQIQRFVSQVHRRFGQLSIVVNNAARAWVGRFADQAVASIDEIIEVNIKGVLYATRAVLPILLQQKQGTIINVSSGAGLSGHPEIATYCASKFALVGFTESLALEVGTGGYPRLCSLSRARGNRYAGAVFGTPGRHAPRAGRRRDPRSRRAPPADRTRPVLDYPRLIIGQRTVIGMLSKERNVFILCFLLELGCEPAKLLRNGRDHGSAQKLASLECFYP